MAHIRRLSGQEYVDRFAPQDKASKQEAARSTGDDVSPSA